MPLASRPRSYVLRRPPSTAEARTQGDVAAYLHTCPPRVVRPARSRRVERVQSNHTLPDQPFGLGIHSVPTRSAKLQITIQAYNARDTTVLFVPPTQLPRSAVRRSTAQHSHSASWLRRCSGVAGGAGQRPRRAAVVGHSTDDGRHTSNGLAYAARMIGAKGLD